MKGKELKEQDNLSGKEKKKSLSIFKKKEIWISGVIGLVLGAVLIYVFAILGILGLNQNKTLATFKGGKITESDIYDELKEYGLDYTLQLADEAILDNKYQLTDEQKAEIENDLYSLLSYYGYTEEEFLEEFDLNSKEEIADYTGLSLEYKTNLACIDYFKTLIPIEDIENYYNENVEFGEINTKHILVQVSDNVTEEQALATANEILAKLKKGTSFDDVAKEYEDKVITENVDFDSFSADTLATAYVEASKKLEKDTYTTKAVKTNYGYHIIYCTNKADKPALEEIENDIVEILGEDLEAEDQYIRYKALIKLREDNNLKFKDKDLEADYKEYCEQVNPTEDATTEK